MTRPCGITAPDIDAHGLCFTSCHCGLVLRGADEDELRTKVIRHLEEGWRGDERDNWWLNPDTAWTVIAVVDDTPESSFAYTVGLHDLGAPELWVAAVGQCGHSAGREVLTLALNQLADRAIMGERAPKTELVLGSGTLIFTAVDWGRRDGLQAFATANDARIAVVHWRCCPDGQETTS